MDYKKIGFTDIDGVFRGKYIHSSKFEKSTEIGFCDVVFGWDVGDHVYGKDSVTGWKTGFPDGKLSIDISTKRIIPWDKETPLYLGDFNGDQNLSQVCPRSLLHKIVAEYHKKGIYPKVGFEYEWFNFKKNEDTITRPHENTLTSGMFGYSLLRLSENENYAKQLLTDLPAMNIPIEGFHTETGPGVYECALQHRDALDAADQAILFKYFVKEIALQHNILATFMAKWNADLPGCGNHINVSLADENGNNLLTYDADHKISGLSSHFLAGVLVGMGPLMPLYAPQVNSYKRYVEGSWAATSVCYGFQNRTAAIRLISGKQSRVEYRVPGADANPYLALYGILASGLYGIKEGLNPKHSPIVGNAYEQSTGDKLPQSLEEAIRMMETSDIPARILNHNFIDHYLMTRRWEVEQFRKAVTDWELNRYFEIT